MDYATYKVDVPSTRYRSTIRRYVDSRIIG